MQATCTGRRLIHVPRSPCFNNSTIGPHRSLHSRGCTTVQALTAEAAFAVSQQAFIFAAVVGAEAAWSGLNTPADVKGRPAVVSTLAAAGGTAVGAVLVKQGGDVGTAGCAVALAAAAFALLNYGLRVRDTPYNPEDWPGAKATPAVMALLAFFALQAAVQGLRDGFGQLN